MSVDRMIEAVWEMHEENKRLKAEIEILKGVPPPDQPWVPLVLAAKTYLERLHWSPSDVQVGRVQRPQHEARAWWQYELIIRFSDMRKKTAA